MESKQNKHIEKEIRFVTRHRGWGELEEGDEKTQSSRCKINKYWGVMYNMMTAANMGRRDIGKLLRE